jgi:hypothetical protein
MKEAIEFTEFLNVYSCDMQMSLEEILERYSFKSRETEIAAVKLLEYIKEGSKEKFTSYMREETVLPEDFINCFSGIIDYYGMTYSEYLDKRLKFTADELSKIMNGYETSHKENKNLLNKVSILMGCLAAIILI